MFQNQLHEGVELTVRKEYLALAVDDIFLEIEGYRSVLQKYFMVSGTVMRASSHIRKKLSTVVRFVNTTAVCSSISTRWLRNSLRLTPTTLIKAGSLSWRCISG